jgi:ketosteroid isomerase-like protein
VGRPSRPGRPWRASHRPAGGSPEVLGKFTLSGRRRDGTPFENASRFADVLRRQPDGRWLIAVDNPFGGD